MDPRNPLQALPKEALTSQDFARTAGRTARQITCKNEEKSLQFYSADSFI